MSDINDTVATLNSLRDVWLGLYANRIVSVTGTIKFVQSVPNDEGISVYVAELHDGISVLPISWSGFSIDPSPYRRYRVTGRCRAIRDVYPRLANCKIELILDTRVDAADPRSGNEDKKKAPLYSVYSKPEGRESTRGSVAGNWPKKPESIKKPVDSRVDPKSPWGKLRLKVLSRDNYRCARCGTGDHLTVDHIKQLSIGGSNDLSNLQTLCIDCHEEKDHLEIFNNIFEGRDTYGFDTKVSSKVASINGAISSGESLRIEYTDNQGERTVRTIYPKRIYKGTIVDGRLVGQRCVYVSAFCSLRGDERTFRLSRMSII